MDLIIVNDGMYQLIPVTKQIMDGIELVSKVDCFDLCEIIRIKLTQPINISLILELFS